MDASSVCSVSDRSDKVGAGAGSGEDAGAGRVGAGIAFVAEEFAAEDPVTAGLAAGMIGLGGKGDLEGSSRSAAEAPSTAAFLVNEIAVQYVIVTAHQPQGDPVADRQHNNTDNANLKHLGANA